MITILIFGLFLICPGAFGSILDVPSVTTEATNEDVLKKFDIIDKNMREMLNNAIQQALPMLVRSSSEVEVSSECQSSLLKMVFDLRQMKEWPIKMLDASGKIPSGFLSGTVGELGNYDQCLEVANYDEITNELILQGQYCILEIRPPLPPKPKRVRLISNMAPFNNFTSDNYLLKKMVNYAHFSYSGGVALGLCVPSTCTTQDLNNIATYAVGQIGLYADIMTCEIKEPMKIDAVQYALIGIFATFVLLCLVGTAVEMVQTMLNKSSEETKCVSTLQRIVTSFSMDRSIKLLITVDANSNTDLRCIHGIRMFSTLWVILGHTYIFPFMFRNKNTLGGEWWLRAVPFQLITSGTVCMETFFCIAGLVSSYTLIIQSGGVNFVKYIPFIILRRIWRLMPGLLVIIGSAIVMPIIGSGPIWNTVIGLFADNCRRGWFYNVLFINNFLPVKDTCWSHLWYVAMDTQYYILALVTLVIFFKKSAWAIGICIVMIVVSTIVTPIITYLNDLDPIFGPITISLEYYYEFNEYIYWMPYTHLSSYFIGFIAGILITKRKNIHIHIVWQIVGWILSTTVCLAIVLGPYEWTAGRNATPVEVIVYSGLHRPFWAIAISWIIFACVSGYGGVINRILSFQGLIPLSRLSFLVYLWHILVMFYYLCYARDGLFINHVTLVWFYFGTVIATYLLAFVTHVIFDGPLSLLGKIVFGKIMASKTAEKKPLEAEIPTFPSLKINKKEPLDNGQTDGVFVQRL